MAKTTMSAAAANATQKTLVRMAAPPFAASGNVDSPGLSYDQTMVSPGRMPKVKTAMPGQSISETVAGGAAYEKLARFYDGFEGDRGRQVSYLRSLIELHRPHAATLLELGCGTGALLRLLQPHYDVTGIDASAAMLEIAAGRERERLLQADVTNFQLSRKFDVVLCVYDTINHLPTFAGWEALFDRAAEHVCDNGLFLFDMNTVWRLRELAASPPTARWFGDEDLVVVDVEEASALAGESGTATTWRIDVFERATGDHYRRHAAIVEEVAFDTPPVLHALERRFRNVHMHDPEGQPGETTRRMHFVCSLT